MNEAISQSAKTGLSIGYKKFIGFNIADIYHFLGFMNFTNSLKLQTPSVIKVYLV
jgi:hypothetical protein